MTRVDFYVLKEASDAQRLKLACRLVERAYLEGLRVLALTQDAAAAAQFDELLWTFADRAFVPHEPAASDPAASVAPVQIGSSDTLPAASADAFDVLVNLRGEAVPASLGVSRIIEVVDGEESRRQAGRERYRAYREMGITPSHHTIENESLIENG